MSPGANDADNFTDHHEHESRVCNVPGSWHNRSGKLVRQVHENVWVIERGYYHSVVDVGGKTTIIRLDDGRLFVHSPLPLDAELKAAVDELGTVSAVVAPNDEHRSFVVHWKKQYPNATFLAPPGLISRHPEGPFTAELSSENTTHASYADDSQSILQFYCGPFAYLNETVFYHAPSKTLITTDIAMNFTNDVPTTTQLANFLLSRVFMPFIFWRTTNDRTAFKSTLDQIEALPFTTLIPCHGDVETADAQGAFKRWRNRVYG